MLAKRIIPCLDVRNGKVVKGVNFEGIRDVGDPVECAAEYNKQGADEIVFYDITASYEGRGVFLEIELPYEWADNYQDRLRRRSFYVDRVGLIPMGTTAKLFGVDMELLGSGCHLTYDEYRNFYLNNYGRFAYDNIAEADGKS